MSSLMPVTINGVTYYQFLLDVNQTGSNPFISLNTVQIYGSSVANPNPSNLGTLVFNMDTGSDGNVTVNLNYALGSGSGSGDLFMYIPTANLPQNGYMVFFTSFGNPYATNDGFEEWAVVASPTPIPEPGTLALFGTGLLGIASLVRRRLIG